MTFVFSAGAMAATTPLVTPPCELVDVSYQLSIKLELFSKEKEFLPPSYLTFSMCKLGFLATELLNSKPGTFRKAAGDYLSALIKNEPAKFKAFFDDDKEELEQYETLLNQFKFLSKKENINFENVIVNESVEDPNWALFGFNLKGKFGTFNYKATFKKNQKGQIKVAIMKLPNQLVNEFYSQFVMSNKPRVTLTQIPSHEVILEKYAVKSKTPMIKFQFSALSSESIHYKGMRNAFKNMTAFAIKNNKKEFLKNVKSPESYQKDWGFSSDNKELLGLANYWKDLVPVAGIDLEPTYLLYLADKSKSKIVHVYRFVKSDDKYLLLNEVSDLNQKLFTLSPIKEAALEETPFKSLRIPVN